MCAHTERKFTEFLFFQPANYHKFIKNVRGVRSVRQLIREVLPSPVLIMFSIPPQPGDSYVINITLVSDPNLRFILTVPKR